MSEILVVLNEIPDLIPLYKEAKQINKSGKFNNLQKRQAWSDLKSRFRKILYSTNTLDRFKNPRIDNLIYQTLYDTLEIK